MGKVFRINPMTQPSAQDFIRLTDKTQFSLKIDTISYYQFIPDEDDPGNDKILFTLHGGNGSIEVLRHEVSKEFFDKLCRTLKIDHSVFDELYGRNNAEEDSDSSTSDEDDKNEHDDQSAEIEDEKISDFHDV